MTNDELSSNAEGRRKGIRNSGFVIVSTFVIRASSFRHAALHLALSDLIVNA